jgi:hypothetical protein
MGEQARTPRLCTGRRPRRRQPWARWLLAASLAAVFLAAPTAAQAAREHCCFKVSAFVDGNLTYNYGDNPNDRFNGGGFYIWTWAFVDFVEVERDARGRPELRHIGPSKTYSRLYEATPSLTKRDIGTGTHTSIACQEDQTTGKFVAERPGIAFSGALPGYLELTAQISYDPRCDHGDFSHDPDQLGQEFPPELVNGFGLDRGAWSYDIKAGPRKRYTQDRNFQLALDHSSEHPVDPQANNPHEAHRNAVVRVRFAFVPRSELRRERRRLRRCRQGCAEIEE